MVILVIDALSDKITGMIKQNVKGISEEKEEIVNYGLNILIYQTAFTAGIFILALLVGLFKYVLASLVVYAFLRVFAGGAHARTRVQCSVSNLIILFVPALASKYIWAGSYWPAVFVLAVNLVAIYIYAPGDTEERPIISKRIRMRQKVVSLLLAAAIFAISVVAWHYDRRLYNVITITTLFPSFLLTPVGYKLFKCKQSSQTSDINQPQ